MSDIDIGTLLLLGVAVFGIVCLVMSGALMP